MATNIAVITDSCCSLPNNIIEKYHIERVPVSISIDDRELPDPCNDQKALAMFRSGDLSKKHNVSTSPPTVDHFEKAIYSALNEGKNMIVVQTVNRTQGDTYNNANAAASSVRRRLGEKQRDINIRVMDSRTVFAGQGLMTAETIRRMAKGQNPGDVRREMDKFSEKIHTFMLPKEPLLALERSQKRNENSVGWTQAFIADTLGIYPVICNVNDDSHLAHKGFGFKKTAQSLFNHASNLIQEGLLSPLLTINYAGPLHELKELPGYRELKNCAKFHDVKIIPSVMSVSGGIYSSVGSISLALACEPHDWK